MANFSFAKYSRREKLKFFQSSLPYLHNNALITRSSGTAKRWFSEEPHPTSSSFLTFKNGHYGIYFTLFNHELRKKEHDGTYFDHASVIVIAPGPQSLAALTDFFISKAKQDTHNDINWLKTVATNLLSTASLVKSKYTVKQLYHTRAFTTSAPKAKDKSATRQQPNFENHTNVALEDPTRTIDVPAEGELHEQPFEESFLATQVTKITEVFENHVTPDDLNAIYPIYQSLKRNNIRLTKIALYNIVSKSIAMRSLDSEISLPALESRLTCLLTVYQDILLACQSNSDCHPTSETYRIVLDAIFGGSKQLLSQHTVGNSPSHSVDLVKSKCQEFCQVGTNLFISLSEDARSSLDCILPNTLYCLTIFPSLLNTALASSMVQMKDIESNNAQLYANLISLTGALSKFDHLNLDKKGSYEFISGVFNNYKKQSLTNPSMADAEYEVYSALLKALVATGNLPIATKFLDKVMETYKNDVTSHKITTSNTKGLSDLVSNYLQALLESGDPDYLERAHGLIHSMREVAYLPELNISVYNDMICRYIAQYTKEEISKATSENVLEANRHQKLTYRKIWDLYNYVAIRNDFTSFASSLNTPSAIEELLSLSIDLNDASQISRLLKEIMVKDIPAGNWSISRKLCQYLSRSKYSESVHHHRLMWAFIEQQSMHLRHDHALLNDFLSEHVLYLVNNDRSAAVNILNSRLVRDAFDTFSLSKHNLHGVSVVISYLRRLRRHIRFTESESAKILHYHAQLLNEFEDTENHYLELTDEMKNILGGLKASFQKLSSSTRKSLWTASVRQACVSVGVSTGKTSEFSLPSECFEIDLIPHLSVGSQHGTKLFYELLTSGYNFNHETWKAMFNRSFVITLATNKPIRVADLFERIFRLESKAQVVDLTRRVISWHNDKVNIELFKFLVSKKHTWALASHEVLTSFAEFSGCTRNQYFLTLLKENFIDLTKLNSDKTWMYPIFEKFNEAERSIYVDSLVSQNFELFNKGLKISHKPDELFLKSVLNAFMKTGNLDKVNEIFQYHFPRPEDQKLLVSSGDLFACFLEYYSHAGSHELVSKNYGRFAKADSPAKQSIQFAHLISSLESAGHTHGLSNDDNLESFALSLLSTNNLLEMQKLYKANKHLVENKENFFNILIDDLAKAVKCLSETSQARVVTRFEAVIKFCKVIQLRSISAKTLKNLVNFLTLCGSKNLLNILFNKFMISNTLLSSFNFYFLKVELQSKTELDDVLHEFENGFKSIGDAINLQAIEEFKTRSC